MWLKIIDLIINISEKYESYDFMVLLQPTSPLRDKKEVDRCLRILKKKNLNCFKCDKFRLQY